MIARSRTLRLAVACAVTAALLGVVLAAPALAQGKRHHIGIGLGYNKHLSDDLDEDNLGYDFTNTAMGSLHYRYSLSPMLDLALDTRATIHTEEIGNADVRLTSSFVGPGVRLSGSGTVRPYAQANVYFVTETLEIEEDNATLTFDESGAGFGILAGVDIRASNLLSVPIELSYLYGKPEDDVSGIGISAGLTFNFGAMP